MPRETFAETVEAWGRFVRQVNESGIEMPGTGSAKDDLEAMYNRAHQLIVERRALDAAKQAATRELQEILEKGRMKHTLLRRSLKVNLGFDNETLTAYGIQPSRRRRRRSPEPDSQE